MDNEVIWWFAQYISLISDLFIFSISLCVLSLFIPVGTPTFLEEYCMEVPFLFSLSKGYTLHLSDTVLMNNCEKVLAPDDLYVGENVADATYLFV